VSDLGGFSSTLEGSGPQLVNSNIQLAIQQHVSRIEHKMDAKLATIEQVLEKLSRTLLRDATATAALERAERTQHLEQLVLEAKDPKRLERQESFGPRQSFSPRLSGRSPRASGGSARSPHRLSQKVSPHRLSARPSGGKPSQTQPTSLANATPQA